jgi:hypothetical protein
VKLVRTFGSAAVLVDWPSGPRLMMAS